MEAEKSHDAIKSIRRSLGEREVSMPEGTIVRFVREKKIDGSCRSVTLNYAAIFVNNRWYLTGTAGVGADSYTNKEFMDLLASGDYSNIAVATHFKGVDE